MFKIIHAKTNKESYKLLSRKDIVVVSTKEIILKEKDDLRNKFKDKKEIIWND